MTLRSGHPRTVVIIAFDGVRLLDVAGPLEVLTAAATAGASYTTRLVSPRGGEVSTHAGTALTTSPLDDLEAGPLDTVMVPGAVDWAAAIADDRLIAMVRTLAARSRRVASVCAGAFLLGAAGLLDGHTVATHWRLTDELAARFPTLSVNGDAIHIRSGNVYSSAGVTAGIDLSLALVEDDHGPALARAVAQDLVVFMQRPGGQAQFSARLSTPLTDHAPLRSVLDAVVADPAADHRLSALSERCGFSERHVTRLFQSELGTTPARYVERVRLEAARDLLEQTRLSLEVVAARSGLGSAETLRRIFVRELGVAPNAYRRRFASTRRPS